MRKQSKSLEDTVLWKVYKKRMSADMARTGWLEKVYQASAACLKDVRQTFKNYTLHDEIHILNVLDAMGGLLGDCIENLSDAEMEILILAASLHDIGMVYTEEEIIFSLEDEEKCRDFLRENHPELLGCEPKNWPEDVRQWYLRTRHPFRISEVLLHTEWKNLFEERPAEIVSKRCILAVCQAHGEKPEDLCTSQYLKYQAASEADPLFCALLLRLADLLDFDDTRAPGVLYSYVEDNEKSRAEWDKHQASAGFSYPQSPSVKELPYKACCKNPAVEHAVRKFLDWVDDELDNCARLQRYCHASWQKEFPFPRVVLRSEIESDGYMSGDFCLTMDQEKVLKLLMGENLYDNRDVFVRELLQNAVDATLLRSEMDSDFVLEDARIDIWEWSDSEGNFWFRIDDQGTGMTLGMLQRYFLKVGNSYYTSQELKRDLLDHGMKEHFYGISRFGIGFLSCFLCGDYAEVSTIYFDPQKNRREEPCQQNMQTVRYGLRLQMTGLSGYYMLKSQAENHISESKLPMPSFCDAAKQVGAERYGYRIKPGTSVLIHLEPGKLGALDLHETVKKYLCGAKMPVYYNGRQIGRTYSEAMNMIHEMIGKKTYELDSETKKTFDECFPEARGNYPKLVQTVIPLDTEENQILSGLSGVIVKQNICFDYIPQWSDKDQSYEIAIIMSGSPKNPAVIFQSRKLYDFLEEKDVFSYVEWKKLEVEYGFAYTKALGEKLEAFDKCPQSANQLGDAWIPFSKDLDIPTVWEAYINASNIKALKFAIDKYRYLSLDSIFKNTRLTQTAYVYQGILAGYEAENNIEWGEGITLFFLEGEWMPAVKVSRSKLGGLPFKVLMAIYAIFYKYNFIDTQHEHYLRKLINWKLVTLEDWRMAMNSSVGQWIEQNQKKDIEEIIERLQEPYNYHGTFFVLNDIIMKYAAAYLQNKFSMTINYEEGQTITFYEKQNDNSENVYDMLPSMMFCKAASEQSKKYICHAFSFCRRGITADHPFMAWLLQNAIRLRHNFQRQFQQIIESFCTKDAEDIVQIYDIIQKQIYSLSGRYDIDVKSLPQLTLNDFWID